MIRAEAPQPPAAGAPSASGALRPLAPSAAAILVALPCVLSILSRLPALRDVLDLSRLLGFERPESWPDLAIVFWPSLAGAAWFDAFQLAGAVAGRGRSPPGASLGPHARALVFAGFATWTASASTLDLPQTTATLLASIAFFVASEALARAGAPSPAVISLLAYSTLEIASARSYGFAYEGRVWEVVQSSISIASVGLVALTLHRLRLGRPELASLGVRPRAPLELGLISEGARVMLVLCLNQSAWLHEGYGWMYFYRWAHGVVAALVILALVRLARLRRAPEACERASPSPRRGPPADRPAAGPTRPGTAAPRA